MMDSKKKNTAAEKRKAVESTIKDPFNKEKEINAENLKYNDEEDSFELDVDSHVKNYQHPSQYDTAAEDGDDMDSDWDEANQYVGNEYDEKSFASEIEKQEMHIDEGKIIEHENRKDDVKGKNVS